MNAPAPLLDPNAGPKRATPTPTPADLWAMWAQWMRQRGYESRIPAARQQENSGAKNSLTFFDSQHKECSA
jgi:hypothetical protein